MENLEELYTQRKKERADYEVEKRVYENNISTSKQNLIQSLKELKNMVDGLEDSNIKVQLEEMLKGIPEESQWEDRESLKTLYNQIMALSNYCTEIGLKLLS